MLRLSKLGDYAIVMVAHLARTAHVCVHPATGIAEATGIPLPTVAKVLKALARDGILVSTRGAHGGYGLGRDPATISVVDVLEAIDGPMSLTDCAHAAGSTCSDEAHCHLPPHWPAINAAVREALSKVSMLDLAGKPERRSVIVPTAVEAS